MEKRTHLYETTFIVNASLEDAQIESAIAHATETITRNGGEVQAVNKWGRKRLAYTIQKKNNGFYVNMEFAAPGAVIPQLERIFLLDENILRFLTIVVDKKALKARQQVPVAAPAASPLPPAAPQGTESPEREKEPLFRDTADESPASDNK